MDMSRIPEASIDTYKKPTRVESVDIDADWNAGQVVDPEREMQLLDMAAAAD